MRNEMEIGLRWLLCASLVRLRKVEYVSLCAELCGANEILKLKTNELWSDGEMEEEWWK